MNFNDESINQVNSGGENEGNTVSLPPIAPAKTVGIRFNSNPKNLSRDVSGSEE